MKRLCIFLFGFLLLNVSFSACGSQREQSTVEESFAFIEEAVEEEEDDFDRTGLTWDNTQWVNPLMTDSKIKLYTEKYQQYSWAYPDSKSVCDGCIAGNTYYMLKKVVVEDGYDYVIEGYDVDKQKGILIPLDREALFQGNEHSQIEYFYVNNENDIVILIGTFDEDQITGLTAIHVDGEGTVDKRVDIFDAFRESNICPAIKAVKGRIRIESADANYYYLRVHGYTPIAIVNRDGALCCRMTTATGEDEFEYNCNIVANKTADGQTVFWCTEGKVSTWYSYSEESGIRKLTQNDNYPVHGSYALSEDGYCYVINDDWLVRWDIFTGKAIKLFNYVNEGISENYNFVRIMFTETGCPILCRGRMERLEIYQMSYQKPNLDNYLTVVSFANNCKELELACADYTRQHPSDGIWVEKPSGDLDTYRTRLLAEMIAGRGPDAMYVTPADMQTFYEKGLLENLTGYLSPELEQQIFKGVLDCGKIDRKQIGYAMVANLSGMLVNRSAWDKDTWSISDVMKLIESNRLPDLEIVALISAPEWKGGHFSSGVLNALALQDLNNTPFLDLATKTCNFDSPEFIQLLEICKKYPKTLLDDWDVDKEVAEGRLLTYVGDVQSLQSFSNTLYEAGDNVRCMGFPSENGYGSYWNCDYLLVVRKGSDKKDTVIQLMESLYDLNNQRKMINPVNRKVFAADITKDNLQEGYYLLDCGDMCFLAIRGKRDGSSYVQEFLDFADKSVPLPHAADMAAQIVREEVDAYFYGDKDAASVAKIIQNRVKLWMMEQM